MWNCATRNTVGVHIKERVSLSKKIHVLAGHHHQGSHEIWIDLSLCFHVIPVDDGGLQNI